MALILNLYSINKRSNSTKLPTGNGTVVEVNLKAPTSLIKPIFIIDGVNETYNYCKFEGRYYWIDDIIILSNNLMELHCSVDVLATYRSQILASTQYVVRSASESDEMVIDTLYPTRATSSYSTTNLTNPFGSIANCYYMVGVVGPSRIDYVLQGYSSGSTQYYLLTASQLTIIINRLMQDDVATQTFFNISQETLDLQLQKAILDPLKYFVSCKKVPSFIRDPQSLVQISTSEIKLGWNYTINDLGSNVVAITPVNYSHTFEIEIPKHPQAENRGAYLNLSPYSDYTLYLEPFGLIPLDTTKLIGVNKVDAKIQVDGITGDAILTISAKTGAFSNNIAYAKANVYIDLQISQIAQDFYAQRHAAINMAGSAASMLTSGINGSLGGALGGAVGMAHGITSLEQAKIPQLEKSGVNGSNIIYDTTPKLHAEFRSIVGEDNEDLGRPLMQKKVLSTLSGYCLCNDADIELNATTAEIDQVKSYLMEGFFIE